MNEIRDKFLTETIGEDWNYETNYDNMNNFSTWAGFGKLWEWAFIQDWWTEFLRMHNMGAQYYEQVACHYINPDIFANELCLYLKGK